MISAQVAIAMGVSVFGIGFTCMMIGIFLGIQMAKKEAARAREALGVTGSANMRVLK